LPTLNLTIKTYGLVGVKLSVLAGWTVWCALVRSTSLSCQNSEETSRRCLTIGQVTPANQCNEFTIYIVYGIDLMDWGEIVVWGAKGPLPPVYTLYSQPLYIFIFLRDFYGTQQKSTVLVIQCY